MITKTFADFQKDSTGQYKKVGYNTFTVLEPENNYIRFYKDGKYIKVRVYDSDKYVYAFNKKSMSAIGGAAGLYEFLKYETGENGVLGFFLTVLNKVFNYYGGDTN